MWQRMKIPVAVVVLLAGVIYVAQEMARSPQLLAFNSARFWQVLIHMNLSYLLLASLFVYASYFFRSLRWQQFLAPIKPTGLWNILSATLIGFSAVALLGRPGELVRPVLIARKERLGLSSQLGAWTLERILDVLMVGIMLGAAMLIAPPVQHTGALGARLMAHLRTGGIIVCAAAIAMTVLLSQFRRHVRLFTKILLWFARLSPKRWRASLERVLASELGSFTDGLASIASISRFAMCMAYSMLVWGTVVVTYWALARSFGAPLSSLGVAAQVVVMSASVLGSIFQIPGIGGGTQVATVLAFTQLYGIRLGLATMAAILLWVLGFVIVLIPGLPIAAHQGLSWRRLSSLAKSSTLSTAPAEPASTSSTVPIDSQ